MEIIFTKHAQEMLIFRNIPKDFVTQCIEIPDEILPARENKKIYLKNFGRNYLKVVVSKDNTHFVIITLH